MVQKIPDGAVEIVARRTLQQNTTAQSKIVFRMLQLGSAGTRTPALRSRRGGTAVFVPEAADRRIQRRRRGSWRRLMGAALLLLAVLAARAHGAAAFIYVPDDYPTIQEGIAAAADHDMVLVADGTYRGLGNRGISFMGKQLAVVSENGPLACIIDCEGADRGFNFDQNEGENAFLVGFTIRRGAVANGAGINCYNASPTIEYCVIENNQAQYDGGGIACSLASPVIIDCLIVSNEAANGAGVHCLSSSPLIINSTFGYNLAAESGGGLYSSDDSVPTLSSCIIWDNAPDSIGVMPGSYPMVSYSDVSGGAEGTGNLDAEPRWATGVLGSFYLSCRDAGQPADSPCLDAGEYLAYDVCFYEYTRNCLDIFTTRTDGVPDAGQADLGFHYPQPPAPTASPTPAFTETPAATETMVPTATFTATRTPSFTPTRSATATSTPTLEPTMTATTTPALTPTRSATATMTVTASPANTPTSSPSAAPTLTATPSPTLSATPSATPNAGLIILKLSISKAQPDCLGAGDECTVAVSMTNPSPPRAVDLYCVLDAFGAYFFYPGWSYELQSESLAVPSGESSRQLISFTWPGGAGRASDLDFVSALTGPDDFDLLSNVDTVTFCYDS